MYLNEIFVDQDIDKAAIVCSEATNHEFWLATDWNRKPTIKLEGLSIEQLKGLQERLIKKHNWLSELSGNNEM